MISIPIPGSFVLVTVGVKVFVLVGGTVTVGVNVIVGVDDGVSVNSGVGGKVAVTTMIFGV